MRGLPSAFYTQFVIISRWSLWVLIGVVVIAVVWVASSNNGKDGTRLVFSSVTKNEAMQNVMEKPRYQGMDQKNQPFTVIAERAIQKDKDTIELHDIHADMNQQDGSWLALNSGVGELNLETKKIKLERDVNMFYDGGYEFRTSEAQVDINKGSAQGSSHIEGQGPAGILQADSFIVENRGQVIKFNGSVRMTLYP